MLILRLMLMLLMPLISWLDIHATMLPRYATFRRQIIAADMPLCRYFRYIFLMRRAAMLAMLLRVDAAMMPQRATCLRYTLMPLLPYDYADIAMLPDAAALPRLDAIDIR